IADLLPLGFAFVAGKQADHRGVLGVFSRPMMPKAGFLEVPFSPDALRHRKSTPRRAARLHDSRRPQMAAAAPI
ncbi:hypothetical protein, partial [uncultured Xanthomonas sp.]|uniref:hypothetical protein n=1 Tax=uncultured Xanthomonas sp. TaxID=152831 RepID=UPI0025DA9812